MLYMYNNPLPDSGPLYREIHSLIHPRKGGQGCGGWLYMYNVQQPPPRPATNQPTTLYRQ